jgi:hypothetical protein
VTTLILIHASFAARAIAFRTVAARGNLPVFGDANR